MIDEINTARILYLKHLRSIIRSYRTNYIDVAPELLLELKSSEAKLYKNRYRIDLACKEKVNGDVKLTEANLDTLPRFPAQFIESDQIRIEVLPLTWNGVELTVRGIELNSVDLADWFEKWIDESELRECDGDGLTGVIHSMSIPTHGSDGSTVGIDFGSAPMVALEEFIALLAGLGCKELKLRTPASGLS